MGLPLRISWALSSLLLSQGGLFTPGVGEFSQWLRPWRDRSPTALPSLTHCPRFGSSPTLNPPSFQTLTPWNLPPTPILTQTPNSSRYPTSAQLKAWARQITIQIQQQGQPLGSGVLVQRQGNTYTVLTSHHLFLGSGEQYSIRTADDRRYPATFLPRNPTAPTDLQLLQFTAPGPWYPLPFLLADSSPQLNEAVMAAGFPIQYDSAPTPEAKFTLPNSVTAVDEDGFAVRSGLLSLILPQPLEGGYQLGFTSDVFKGFSGGPLLNAQGEVIGVVGRHANPLWEVIQYYEDGTEPPEPLQRLIAAHSWAVPIDRATLPFVPSPASVLASTALIPLPQLWPDVRFPVPTAAGFDRLERPCVAASSAFYAPAPTPTVPASGPSPGAAQ